VQVSFYSTMSLHSCAIADFRSIHVRDLHNKTETRIKEKEKIHFEVYCFPVFSSPHTRPYACSCCKRKRAYKKFANSYASRRHFKLTITLQMSSV
jgi:hypothetical protein